MLMEQSRIKGASASQAVSARHRLEHGLDVVLWKSASTTLCGTSSHLGGASRQRAHSAITCVTVSHLPAQSPDRDQQETVRDKDHLNSQETLPKDGQHKA